MGKRNLILTNKPLNSGGILLINKVNHTETGEQFIVEYLNRGKFRILPKENNILYYEEYISNPNTLSKYKHFKGNMYSVLGTLVDDNNNEFVVYQALYDDYKYYMRPMEMFLSEVDNVKYPNVKQKYRFEYVKE